MQWKDNKSRVSYLWRMRSILVRGLERGRQVAVLNRVVREDLIKKGRLMQRLEGDEEVNQMISCGRIIQTNCTTKAKTLD